jgi:hypothetical protein
MSESTAVLLQRARTGKLTDDELDLVVSMVLALVLDILCNDWSLADRYMSYVERFIGGVDWDRDDDVRAIAMSIAANRIRSGRDRQLLSQLIEIADDSNQASELRAWAYFCIGRAMDEDWAKRLGFTHQVPMEAGSPESLLSRARTFVHKRI